MPRSLANGDYSLVMAIESASRPNSWYRVLSDRRNGNLTCDCPAWTFQQEPYAVRSCKHTHLAQLLLTAQHPASAIERASGTAANANPLVQATCQQWPGLGGRWSIEQRDGQIDGNPYRFILLRLVTGNGGIATGTVAFSLDFHPTVQSMVAGVAGWAGYAIAAEAARLAGFPLAGQPPEHFRVTRTRRKKTGLQPLGLTDILRVGDCLDLGDGLTPEQRAENTLRLFLGEELYSQLERLNFLDVSSVLYAHEQRVYRVRRDPYKEYERRVRVFESQIYSHDLCIVRDQDVPEADHWLTVFLSLISNEEQALSVVEDYNIFDTYSDDDEEETIPALWQPRVA